VLAEANLSAVGVLLRDTTDRTMAEKVEEAVGGDGGSEGGGLCGDG